MVGAGAIDVWVRSTTPNVDLQATVSEISPDGNSETFVQGGWVRTKARKLDPAKSTELEPVLSLKQEDFKDMPSGKFVKVTIPLYYEGHMYRQGSRIRVLISAPNGDQPIWSFGETDPNDVGTNVEIGYGGLMNSRLLLPVATGVSAPANSQPACNSLRGEPCRAYASSTGNTLSPNQPTNGDVLDESPPSNGGSGGSNGSSQGQAGAQTPTTVTTTARCKKRKRHHRAAAAKKKHGCKKKKRHRHR